MTANIWHSNAKRAIGAVSAISLLLLSLGYYYHAETASRSQKRISELEKKLSHRDGRAESLRAELTSLESRAEKVASEFGQLEERVKRLKESTISLSDDYTVWDEAIPQIQKSSGEILTQTESLRVAISDLSSALGVFQKSAGETDGVDQIAPPIVSSESAEKTVYVTRTGSKYHRAGCQYLSRSMIPISLKDAKARYSACSRCW